MLQCVIVSILLGMVYSARSDDKPCPANVLPCFCEEDYDNEKSVYCENVRRLDLLLPVVKQTRGINVTFGFYRSKMGDIPSDFFEGHQSVSVSFDECDISSFGSRPFSGLEDSLQLLHIYGSASDLETLPLGHLKKLRFFAFAGNFDIKRLGNDWFNGGPKTLRQLNLESNDFEELGDRIFADLINVEQIWMGENKYDKVSRSMFPRPANKLDHIEMSFNRLTYLPEDIFDDMPVLNVINVSGNKLATISEAVFGRIWGQLKDIYVQRNTGFKCDERLKWILAQTHRPRVIGNCQGGKPLYDFLKENFE